VKTSNLAPFIGFLAETISNYDASLHSHKFYK